MSRKNIFEIMEQKFDLSTELKRIYILFEKRETVYTFGQAFTLRNYIKSKGFATWRNRGRCIDSDEFLSLLNYKDLWETATKNKQSLFTLIEIIYNFWYIAQINEGASYAYDTYSKDFTLLKKIMDDCLAYYNYKGEYTYEFEQLIVIEDKPEATAVAEIVDNELSYKVLRYNHYILKGDLDAKKDILLALGKDLEPKRKQLHEIDKTLEDNIFFILNNLDIRHNNKIKGDKYFIQFVFDMDDSTMEGWYDELYQMILLAYLQIDQVDRNNKVKTLKQEIS